MCNDIENPLRLCPVCDEIYSVDGDNAPIVGISMGDDDSLLCRACELDAMSEDE